MAAGTVAAINPSGFATLPAYLSFFVAESDAERRRHPVARALTVTAAMTAGFVLVFGAAGLAAEAASLAIVEWTPWVTLAIGLALIPLGLFLLAGHELTIRLPRLQRGDGDSSALSMELFGASYATVSLSCTLPVFLAAVTGSFRSGSLIGGMAAYGAYALGMGLAVGVVTLAVALAEDGIVSRLRGVLSRVNRAAGALLVVPGAYVAYYGYFEVRQLRGDRVAAGGLALIAAIGTRLAAMALGVVMLGAIVFVTADLGLISSEPMPGAELDLAYLAGLATLVAFGPGRLSADAMIGLDGTGHAGADGAPSGRRAIAAAH
ncbi:MAG: cytochrome c biogenesis CcdA family protein [Acidimicrobiia bacterium]|nr:cytochrome c biogenesis CcdA family protein [Acidimicrobiia bacterium]